MRACVRVCVRVCLPCASIHVHSPARSHLPSPLPPPPSTRTQLRSLLVLLSRAASLGPSWPTREARKTGPRRVSRPSRCSRVARSHGSAWSRGIDRVPRPAGANGADGRAGNRWASRASRTCRDSRSCWGAWAGGFGCGSGASVWWLDLAGGGQGLPFPLLLRRPDLHAVLDGWWQSTAGVFWRGLYVCVYVCVLASVHASTV